MNQHDAMAVHDQVGAWDDFVCDPRGRIPTGIGPLDMLLRSGGLAPGELVVWGGHTGTRKTTVMLNVVHNMLAAGVHVGVVGLDEPRHSYVGKLMSVMTQRSVEEIEALWPHQETIDQYHELARNLVLYTSYQPNTGDLTKWVKDAEMHFDIHPQVVFIDYTSLMHRPQYQGQENQRVIRLLEEVQVWTNRNDLVTVALHQVGRTDEGVGVRYHGHTPMSLEGLKYGGEEVADVVLGTYRPSLDPVAHMTWEMAKQVKGERFTVEDWEKHRELAKKWEQFTFVQLLKNRPGTRVERKGIPLRSVGDSMKIKAEEEVFGDEELGALQAYG